MKIKLRDLSLEQYKKWGNNYCKTGRCYKCMFSKVCCNIDGDNCWFFNKDLYNDKFLDQEVEVEPILTDKEREYLSTVIKPFRDRVKYIAKYEYDTNEQFIEIEINDVLPLIFPLFEENEYYKGMEVDKKYTLEELGL